MAIPYILGNEFLFGGLPQRVEESLMNIYVFKTDVVLAFLKKEKNLP